MALLPLLKDIVWDQSTDVLGQAAAANTLTRAIRTVPNPACIAVYGSWGTGKTTFIGSAFRFWSQQGPAVWFDPWEHEQRQDVISPLLHAICKHAEASGRADEEKLRSLAASIAKTLLSLSLKVGAHWLFGDSALLKPLSEIDPKDVSNELRSWSQYHSEIQKTKADFRYLVDLIIGDNPTSRLVVFLDDLDRCLPDSVIKLLESIKLLLCGHHGCRVVFVFAIDRQIVGEAIAQRYPISTTYTGESYLEKIFDLSLEIPTVSIEGVGALIQNAWSPSLVSIVREVFAPLGGINAVSSVLADPAFGNPRVIKRVLNRLVLFMGSEEASAFINGLVGEDAKRRFIVWIAGGERFRSFRYAFMDATKGEIAGLHEFIRTGDVATPSRLLDIARTPGFRRYYELLGLADSDAVAADRQRLSSSGGSNRMSATLRDYDEALRGAGL